MKDCCFSSQAYSQSVLYIVIQVKYFVVASVIGVSQDSVVL
jgi:hypothetical protein